MKHNRIVNFKPATPQPQFDTLTPTPVSTDVLLDILSHRRTAWGDGEQLIIDKYLMPMRPDVDSYGNLFVTLTDAFGRFPTIAFAAHTDTVHYSRDIRKPDPVTHQRLRLRNHIVTVDPGNDCLGADDGTGVWILLNLIKAGIPGLYCFFRDEESGRLGSEWSVEFQPQRYAGIQAMISFDRMGTTDIITHQMGDRCCSETFAQHLAECIHPGMSPNDGGSFTDSYAFLHLIPECTNVAVGYRSQHTGNESQDLTWATFLVDRLLDIDWEAVPIRREPGDPDLMPCEDMLWLLTHYPEQVALLLEREYHFTAADLAQDLGLLDDPQAADHDTDYMDAYNGYPDTYNPYTASPAG